MSMLVCVCGGGGMLPRTIAMELWTISPSEDPRQRWLLAWISFLNGQGGFYFCGVSPLPLFQQWSRNAFMANLHGSFGKDFMSSPVREFSSVSNHM